MRRLGLTGEQMRLLERTYTRFHRAGAGLTEEAKKRMAEINERLAQLGTSFSHHLLGDEQDWFLELGEDDRAGLSDSFVAAAKAAAEERGMAGKAIVTLSRSFVEPFLKSSARRDLREKVYKAFTARGDNGNANDNNDVIVEILALREESAKLLGFPTFAAYRLEDSMAKTPEAVRGLLERVWTPARARALADRDELQAADRGGGQQFPARALGLALLRRKAAPGQSQFRRRRDQALSRAGPHDRGRLRLRHAPVRHHLRRAQGCPGLASGRAGLGGDGTAMAGTRRCSMATTSPGPPSARAPG